MSQQQVLATRCTNGTCRMWNYCTRAGAYIHRGAFRPTDSVDVLFIADHGNWESFYHRRALNDSAFGVLSQIFDVTSDNYSYAYTLAVRGWPILANGIPEWYKNIPLDKLHTNGLARIKTDYGAKLTDTMVDCSIYLKADIQYLRPSRIVSMGALGVKSLLPELHNHNITSLMASEHYYQGIPISVVPNVLTILRNPNLRPGWVNQVKMAINGQKVEYNNYEGEVHVLTNFNETMEYLDYLFNYNGEVATDTETANLACRHGNRLGTVQFSTDDKAGYVIPYRHSEAPWFPDELEKIRQSLHKLLSDKSTKIKAWIAHSAKFECNIFANEIGTQILSAPIYDTQIGAFLLDENRSERSMQFKYGPYTLKQLAIDYLNFDGYNKEVLQTRQEGNLMDLPLRDLAPYAAMDSYITFGLKTAQIRDAVNQQYLVQLLDLMYYFYTPIINLFSDIERNGSPVNIHYLRTLLSTDSPIRMAITEIEDNMQNVPEAQQANKLLLNANYVGNNMKVTPLGGEPWVFSFAKKGHPQKLFFDVMNLIPLSIGKSGSPSVDDDWQQRNLNNPIVKQYSEWVLYRKMYDSFVTKLYGYVNPSGNNTNCNTDAKIRPNFLLANVVTGRIACTAPNMQAIPRAENEAKLAVKNIFQNMQPDFVMVQFDYRAAEMRWVTIISKDPAMVSNFNEGRKFFEEYRRNPNPESERLATLYGDIHRQNASKAFNKPLADITKDERQKAKGVSFSILYDSSEKSMAETYGMPLDQAIAMMNNFYSNHPYIRSWKQHMKDHAQKYGYIETPHGRRRRFPIFNAYRNSHGHYDEHMVPPETKSMVADALRQSSNAPIQGISSDGGMLGAALFAQYIRENKKEWYIQNAVHDSMVYQVKIGELRESLAVAEDCLTTKVMEYMTAVWGIEFPIHIEVDAEIGLKWGELEKWDFSENGLNEIIDTLTAELSRD